MIVNYDPEDDFDFLDFNNQSSYEPEDIEACDLDDEECTSCGS